MPLNDIQRRVFNALKEYALSRYLKASPEFTATEEELDNDIKTLTIEAFIDKIIAIKHKTTKEGPMIASFRRRLGRSNAENFLQKLKENLPFAMVEDFILKLLPNDEDTNQDRTRPQYYVRQKLSKKNTLTTDTSPDKITVSTTPTTDISISEIDEVYADIYDYYKSTLGFDEYNNELRDAIVYEINVVLTQIKSSHKSSEAIKIEAWQTILDSLRMRIAQTDKLTQAEQFALLHIGIMLAKKNLTDTSSEDIKVITHPTLIDFYETAKDRLTQNYDMDNPTANDLLNNIYIALAELQEDTEVTEVTPEVMWETFLKKLELNYEQELINVIANNITEIKTITATDGHISSEREELDRLRAEIEDLKEALAQASAKASSASGAGGAAAARSAPEFDILGLPEGLTSETTKLLTQALNTDRLDESAKNQLKIYLAYQEAHVIHAIADRIKKGQPPLAIAMMRIKNTTTGNDEPFTAKLIIGADNYQALRQFMKERTEENNKRLIALLNACKSDLVADKVFSLINTAQKPESTDLAKGLYHQLLGETPIEEILQYYKDNKPAPAGRTAPPTAKPKAIGGAGAAASSIASLGAAAVAKAKARSAAAGQLKLESTPDQRAVKKIQTALEDISQTLKREKKPTLILLRRLEYSLEANKDELTKLMENNSKDETIINLNECYTILSKLLQEKKNQKTDQPPTSPTPKRASTRAHEMRAAEISTSQAQASSTVFAARAATKTSPTRDLAMKNN